MHNEQERQMLDGPHSLSWRRERRETPSHSGFSKILRGVADVVFPGLGLTKSIKKMHESLSRIYKQNITAPLCPSISDRQNVTYEDFNVLSDN